MLQYITLRDDIKLAYIDEGEKHRPTLVFIHGLANFLWVWNWNIAELTRHYRCVALDLPGNGYSSRGDYPYSIEFYTDTVIDFIKQLNLTNVTLCGHSMGGQIAIEAVLKKSIEVDRLILFAPAGFEYFSGHEIMLFKTAIEFGNFVAMDEMHIAQSIHTSFYNNPDIANQLVEELNTIIQNNDRKTYRRMLGMSIHSMLDHQIFPKLKSVHTPTLIFFGENDQLIPNRFIHPVSTTSIAEKGKAEIKDARLVIYKECGHFVQIERSVEVNQEIISFIKGA